MTVETGLTALFSALDSARLSADQIDAPYLSALIGYSDRNPQRLHVPGHGGGAGADPILVGAIGPSPLRLDVPQDLDGVDLGPSPTPYERAEELAAEAYGAGRTWFLTNGASQGNHVICLALAPSGTRVVVQRNCHGSVFDGLVLSGGSPYSVLPGYDDALGIATVVTPDRLRAALRACPAARAAMIVSPTYFGMVADVAGCVEVAAELGVTLVVDCAWGAHFGFRTDLPQTPLRLGADIALTSTHKHAGSMGQSAMLHVAPGREELRGALGRSMRLMRSTSPSSLLLASLDAARRQLVVRGSQLLGDVIAAAGRLRDRIEQIPGCEVLDRSWSGSDVAAWDPLRIVVDVRGTGISAEAITARLRRRDVVPEFHTQTSIVLVIPLGLTPAAAEGVADALGAAVAEGPGRVEAKQSPVAGIPATGGAPPISPREAFLGTHEVVAREAAVGRLSAEAISAYPPGIPTLLPGEKITAEALEHLLSLHAAGLRLHGASDPELRTLLVTR
ncbi:MAG: PLP-dependent transferase [Actinobacteria bacterium]|nr:PLP-dependent transferase [Actinomycetota bacterium]